MSSEELIKEGLSLGLPDIKDGPKTELAYAKKWMDYFCVSPQNITQTSGPTTFIVVTPAGRTGWGRTMLEAVVNAAKSRPR